MPFTLSHAAAVLPLHAAARRRTQLAALVIGSMAPDFVYFLSLGISGAFTHSAAGIFLYCLPAGLVAYLVYHLLLRDAFIAWAPTGIAARMAPAPHWLPRDAGGALSIVVSLALGGHVFPLHKLLQHLSSALGLLVIAACIARWMARTPPCQPLQGRPGAGQRLSVLLVLAGAAAAGSLAGMLFRPAASLERGLFNAVVTGMAAAMLALLLLAAGRRVWLARPAKRRA